MSLANDLIRKSKPSAPKKPDGRVTNQYGVVFYMNDGGKSTKDKLAKHYGIPRSQIQRIYNENNKDYLRSNAEIEKYIAASA